MKLRIPKQDVLYLEDILLDVYTGLSTAQLEGDIHLRLILDRIQVKVYGEDEE